MSLWDKLTGKDQDQPGSPDPVEQSVERYRHLLRTAPPAQLERAHAEAFVRLTPDQRQQVLARLAEGMPPEERPADDRPLSLARAATRAEAREPGLLERRLGAVGGGGIVAGTLFASLAGAVVGTAVAGALLQEGGDPTAGTEAVDVQDGVYDGGDGLGNEFGSDFGGADFGGADLGGI